MTARSRSWPVPADFASPPTHAQLTEWDGLDRLARPGRLARLRARMAEAGVDAYFGVRSEHMRYLTGFKLGVGEDKVAGQSGRFLVSGDEVVVLADSRYTIQARREAAQARLADVQYDLGAVWPDLVASIGARRVAVEGAVVPHATWERLAGAAPEVELVSVDGWVEADRAIKEPSEIERVEAAAAVADRALAALLPRIRTGMTEAELALALEWEMRTNGAEALAFEVASLAGSQAALPHGAPRDEPIAEGDVLLFDFGAQVAGYRSDMTRTLFVGEPGERDLDVHRVVSRAQRVAIQMLEERLTEGAELPSGREVDAAARAVIAEDGRWPAYGHGLGHGIGLATHELPTLSRSAPDTPLPSPTVFSVEPGIYVEGETGVRIEDLVAIDAAAGRLERLTRFPREVIVVGR